jgi:hypothetical protein
MAFSFHQVLHAPTNYINNISPSPSPAPDHTSHIQCPPQPNYPTTPISAPLPSPSSPPGGVPRLPPILQVEKQQVTTSATQMASASRRRNEAHFACPVPGCGSTFTRRFNLRGLSCLSWFINKRRLLRGGSFLFLLFLFLFAHQAIINRSFEVAYRRAAVCVRVAGLSEGFCAAT